jgi:hypothetical protein
VRSHQFKIRMYIIFLILKSCILMPEMVCPTEICSIYWRTDKTLLRMTAVRMSVLSQRTLPSTRSEKYLRKYKVSERTSAFIISHRITPEDSSLRTYCAVSLGTYFSKLRSLILPSYLKSSSSRRVARRLLESESSNLWDSDNLQSVLKASELLN